jgi:FixJ family two-component response regulator
MPEMTGMEFYERVAEQRPELLGRIVIMTGGAFSPGARSFLDRIANVRIEKPFDNQMLRQLVATVAAERARAR